MSDPHVGSFAVIFTVLYIILQFGLFTEINGVRAAIIPACGFVLSRTLSGFAAVTFKCAKKDGALQNFVKPAHKINSIIILAFFACTSIAVMVITDPICGLSSTAAALITLLCYRISAYRTFGGITGDTEGHFLHICEISQLGASVAAELIALKIQEVI